MISLRVIVELHGSVVEDRLLHVRDSVRLGDSRWADVQFPGADLLIQRRGQLLEVRGHTLIDSVPLTMGLGAVRVTMERTRVDDIERLPPLWAKLPDIDLRVAVATAAVLLIGTFMDAADRFVQNDPVASETVAELFAPGWAEDAEATVRARLEAPDDLPDGISVEPDFELPSGQPPAATYVPLVDTSGGER